MEGPLGTAMLLLQGNRLGNSQKLSIKEKTNSDGEDGKCVF